jgi:hypothetical protein
LTLTASTRIEDDDGSIVDIRTRVREWRDGAAK